MKISHSSKTKYLECSFSWYLHYMIKLRPEKENSPLKFGNAIDLALNKLLLTKDLIDAKKEFEEAWVTCINDNTIKYSKSDLDENLIGPEYEKETIETKSWASLLAKGKIIIEEYAVQVLPYIKKVISVQFEDYIENSTGDKLTIKPDLICEWIDGRILLVDNKTSSVKYEADSVRNSEQLATYYDALKEKYKIDACAYIVIPKRINKKKKPAIEIKFIIDNIDEAMIEKTYNDYQTVLDGIKNAKFEKNFDSCINKYGKCSFYEYCRTGSKAGLKEKET